MDAERRDVARVNQTLPAPEREVLALIAETSMGYAGIAELLGLGPDGVAELAGAGRMRVAAELFGGPRPEDVDGPCWDSVRAAAAEVDAEALERPRSVHVRDCPLCERYGRAVAAGARAYGGWDPGEPPPDLSARPPGPPPDPDAR